MTPPHQRLDALLARDPETVEFLFFWGHRPPKRGGIGVSCFSQWWAGHPFEVDGVTYPTAEHYMMAGKARLFGDEEIAAQIAQASDPGKVKALGRKVRGYDDEAWEAARYDIVVAGNRAKFGEQNPELRQFLLETGDMEIVEASPVDRVWGIGLAADDPRASRPAEWQGRNLLGFALMDVRDELRAAAS